MNILARARSLIKTSLLFLSYLLSRTTARSPEVVVLMYHSVDTSGWKLAVTPEAFERQMQYISRKGWGVSLEDIVAHVTGEKRLSHHAVAVTFDDGYRDLLVTVLPILEKYQVPATIFVPSDFSVKTDPGGTLRLTKEELQILAKSPLITIGSHAKTHRKFTELSEKEMESESKESADEFEYVVGKRPRFFAYPFGARSAEAEDVVKKAGYEAGFSISEGTIHTGDNLFRLKRVQIDGTMSFFLFTLRLTSAVDWNRRLVNVLRI